MTVSTDISTYKEALSQFATGVTIVTCGSDEGPVGITANSFTSVSLNPPLVLWSAARSSKRHDYFANANHFAIHVLKKQQLNLCSKFTKPNEGFEELGWQYNLYGVPIINECLALFECSFYASHDGGDHTIFVGHVNSFNVSKGEPLIFLQGQYSK